MKTCLSVLFVVSFAFGLSAAPVSAADNEIVIPTSTDQIANPVLRGAVERNSPYFNSLPRDSQIAEFDRVYTDLYGRPPYVLEQQPIVVTAPEEVYYPPIVQNYAEPYPYYYDNTPGVVIPGINFNFGWGNRYDRHERRPSHNFRPGPGRFEPHRNQGGFDRRPGGNRPRGRR